jgi:hypothetical protein
MRNTFITILFTVLFIPASFASQDVKYAGFAFEGNANDIAGRFKYTNALNAQKDENGRSIFDRDVLKFFKDNATAMPGVNLVIGEDSQTKIAVATVQKRRRSDEESSLFVRFCLIIRRLC